jgi:hypothetical protein
MIVADKTYREKVKNLTKHDLLLKISTGTGYVSSLNDEITVSFTNKTTKNYTDNFQTFPDTAELLLELRDGRTMRCRAIPGDWDFTDSGLQVIQPSQTLRKKVVLSQFQCSPAIAGQVQSLSITNEGGSAESGSKPRGFYLSNSLPFKQGSSSTTP